LDFDPSAAFGYVGETDEVSLDSSVLKQPINLDFTDDRDEAVIEDVDSKSILAFDQFIDSEEISGFEPVLGGELREKAVWVDESNCIGCQYCVHVANNTFIVDEDLGRARVIRQNGDTLETVQEAMDTCPVDCMHWVEFEDLEKLDASLNRDMFQSLGKLPRVNRY
tara:strand:- start:2050 stop:2547 length:498 start_codon:yes stop_codon:yes gene_type:complete